MGTLQLTQYPMPLQAPAAQSAPFQFSPSAPPNDGEECPVGIEQLWAAHARNVYCSESKKSGMRDDLCKFFCFCSSTFAPRSSARHLPVAPRPSAASPWGRTLQRASGGTRQRWAACYCWARRGGQARRGLFSGRRDAMGEALLCWCWPRRLFRHACMTSPPRPLRFGSPMVRGCRDRDGVTYASKLVVAATTMLRCRHQVGRY